MIEQTTIPLDKAKERTQYWREFLDEVHEESESKFKTKAVFISKADIIGLADILQSGEGWQGVRAYFSLLTDEKEAQNVNKVRLLIVPVAYDPKIPAGKDIVSMPGSPYSGDDDSTIYDFTQPCPEYCDPTSDLG